MAETPQQDLAPTPQGPAPGQPPPQQAMAPGQVGPGAPMPQEPTTNWNNLNQEPVFHPTPFPTTIRPESVTRTPTFWDHVKQFGQTYARMSQAGFAEEADPGGLKRAQLAQAKELGEERMDIQRTQSETALTMMQRRLEAQEGATHAALSKVELQARQGGFEPVRNAKGNIVDYQPVDRTKLSSQQQATLGKTEQATQTDEAKEELTRQKTVSEKLAPGFKQQEIDNKKLALQQGLAKLGLSQQRIDITAARAAASIYGPTGSSKDRAQSGENVVMALHNDIYPVIQRLQEKGLLGAVMGRWTDLATGKIKSTDFGGDPDAAQLATNMDILAKGIMKMHGMRNAEEARKSIASWNIGQDPELLWGHMQGVEKAAETYRQMGALPDWLQDKFSGALGVPKDAVPKGVPPKAPEGAKKKAYQKEGKWYDAATNQPI